MRMCPWLCVVLANLLVLLLHACSHLPQEELVIELYREDEFTEMLREADDAVRRRQEVTALIATLERAQRVVDELRAMPIEGAVLESLPLAPASDRY